MLRRGSVGGEGAFAGTGNIWTFEKAAEVVGGITIVRIANEVSSSSSVCATFIARSAHLGARASLVDRLGRAFAFAILGMVTILRHHHLSSLDSVLPLQLHSSTSIERCRQYRHHSLLCCSNHHVMRFLCVTGSSPPGGSPPAAV